MVTSVFWRDSVDLWDLAGFWDFWDFLEGIVLDRWRSRGSWIGKRKGEGVSALTGSYDDVVEGRTDVEELHASRLPGKLRCVGTGNKVGRHEISDGKGCKAVTGSGSIVRQGYRTTTTGWRVD